MRELLLLLPIRARVAQGYGHMHLLGAPEAGENHTASTASLLREKGAMNSTTTARECSAGKHSYNGRDSVCLLLTFALMSWRGNMDRLTELRVRKSVPGQRNRQPRNTQTVRQVDESVDGWPDAFGSGNPSVWLDGTYWPSASTSYRQLTGY